MHFYFHLQQKTMKVGFMTYDSKINFYNINGALTQPQQMTVGDVNDMFVPLADGLMVGADESEAVIDSLMEQIPQMFADTRETETILGPVIQAGKEAFKVSSHFKIMIFFPSSRKCFLHYKRKKLSFNYVFLKSNHGFRKYSWKPLESAFDEYFYSQFTGCQLRRKTHCLPS